MWRFNMFRDYVKHYKEQLLVRSNLLKLFTENDGTPEFSEELKDSAICLKGKQLGYVHLNNFVPFEIPSGEKMQMYQPVTLKKGDMILADKDISTTVGRVILNYYCGEVPFNGVIPYNNDDVWNIGKYESAIVTATEEKKINEEQIVLYIDNGTRIGHFSELSVPTMSEKSVTTHPDMMRRKKELLKKYDGQLTDPKVAEVIERELKTLDAEHLEGDSAEGFIDAIKGNRDVHRKKLYMTVGGIEAFEEGNERYEFVQNSLAEGLDPEDFATIANEIRKGSYARGSETQKGGTWVKFTLRVFDDVILNKTDCGTKNYLNINITPEFKKHWNGRFIKEGGKLVMGTKDNFDKYVGKSVNMRSVAYCSDIDFCYTCAGAKYAHLGVGEMGAIASIISSDFMLMSMSAMHGTAITTETFDITEFFGSNI